MQLNIPLHEGTQFREIYQEQFEAFHPNSKPVLLHLGIHKAGWFSNMDNSKSYQRKELV